MADVMEHVAYLSQEIGPRPAGTEEEQQAALYITEHMQKEAGLPAVIEDFTGIVNDEIPRAICGGVTFVFTILAVILPAVALPAAIIAIISAVLYIAEAFDKPVLSKLFSRGVSQNVVAKYEPGVSPESGRSRRRKVILVAHYDSGKVRPELSKPVVAALPIVKWVVLGAFALAAIVLLLNATAFLNASGAVKVVLNVISVIAAVIAALPLVQFILSKTASYNDGANCNASGVAVLMDVAARVGRGRTDMSSPANDGDSVIIHGEEAAREEGLIPEKTQVTYEAAPTEAKPNEGTPAERLAAAKAAVAALSGKPVSDFMSEEVLNASIEVKMPEDAPEPASSAAPAVEEGEVSPVSAVSAEAQLAESAAAAPVPQQAVAPVPAVPAQEPAEERPHGGLPAWFIEAQKKAKRSAGDAKPVQRSRYADALDAAMSASSAHFAEANNVIINSAEQRIASMSDGIMEVPAPADAWSKAHPDQSSAGKAAEQPQSKAAAPFTAIEEPRVVEMPAAEVVNAVTEPASNAPQAAPVVREVAAQAEASSKTEEPRQVASILPDNLSVPDLPENDGPAIPSFLAGRSKMAVAEEDDILSSADETVARAQVVAEEEISMSAAAEQPAEPAPVFVDAVLAGTVDTAPAESDISGATQAHQPIVLPNVEDDAVSLDSLKQRAPLAVAYNPEKEHAGNLRSVLPSIDPTRPEKHRPSAAQLRSALPSFSGILPKVDEEEEKNDEPSAVSLTGSFAPVGATSSFAPVGDELLEDVDPEDIYVDDADDSAFDDPYTDAGQFATPGYVEMPKSRFRRLLDHFHRKPKDEESSPQEWLDVDESFDARSAGAARGGWESFREEDADGEPGADDQPDQSAPYAEAYADDSFDDDAIDDYDDFDDFGYEDEKPSTRRSWHGGAFSRVRMGRVDMRSGKEDEPPIAGEDPTPVEPEAPEMQKIYQFRNPDIDTEVWFVALGSELDGHSGMRAFIAEHESELRGSIVIELEALGAGDLCMIDQEGGYRTAKVSSRMKRYTRKATQATGMSLGTMSMLWKSSASSYAITHGVQAMHLVGMEDGKPASFGSRDDSTGNVDEELLEKRVGYIMQLLKII